MLKKKDGSTFNAAFTTHLYHDDDGIILGTEGIIRDITERKRAEQAIRESEEKFRGFAEQSLVGFYIIQDGHFKYVNPKFAGIFGYTVDECLNNMYFDQLVHPEDLSMVEDQVRKRMSEEIAAIQYVFRGIKNTGETIYLEVHGTALAFKGRPAAIGTILDISERRRAEEEQERLQAQLNQAMKMEAVGHLAGGIAHDFNNMLSVVVGQAELAMLELNTGDPIHKRFKTIHDVSLRTAGLVRQLLGFARKQPIQPKMLDLNDTIGGMLKMLQSIIGEDIELVWMPGPNLGKVHVDPSQIDQILANLMVNARDAISGVGNITIETDKAMLDDAYSNRHPGFAPGRYVALAVSDSGCGMDKGILAQIFEPFFTTKTVGQGTGLGLATVYGIVKQNNGFINVYSEPGHGTTFKIFLPLVETPKDQVPEQAIGNALPKGTGNIMLVEDDPEILDLARSILKQLGYSVLTAATPNQAIEQAEGQSGRIDLLITDVVMPQMNGKDLLNRLRGLQPGLKCLFMSGYTANVIANKGILDDTVIFLPKPFSIMELATKVREAIAPQFH